MRTLKLIFLLVLSKGSFGQVLTIAPSIPQGSYTLSQLRTRNDALIDNNNNYWIAFDRIGLARFDGTSWIIYDSASTALQSDKVLSAALDNSNNIYAATKAGLSVYNGSTWQQFN